MQLTREAFEQGKESFKAVNGFAPNVGTLAQHMRVNPGELSRFMAANGLILMPDRALAKAQSNAALNVMVEEWREPGQDYFEASQSANNLLQKSLSTNPDWDNLDAQLDDLVYDVIKARGKKNGMSIESVCDWTGQTKTKVLQSLDRIESTDKYLSRGNGWVCAFPLVRDYYRSEEDRSFRLGEPGELKNFVILILSDTHFGSIAMQPGALNRYCTEIMDKYGDKLVCVLFAGDLVDGWQVFRGHASERSLITFDQQVDFAIQFFPSFGGIPIYGISGNHDEDFVNKQGSDPVKAFARARHDFTNMGRHKADISIYGINFRLWHPMTGGKTVQGKTGVMEKQVKEETHPPDIMVAGHWHTATRNWIKDTLCVSSASFQGQTPYLDRLGIDARIGGHVLDVHVDSQGRLAEVNSLMDRPFLPPADDALRDQPFRAFDLLDEAEGRAA